PTAQALRGDRQRALFRPSEEPRSERGNRPSPGPPPTDAPASPEKGPLDRARRSGASWPIARLSPFVLHSVRRDAPPGPSSSGTTPQTECCIQPSRPPDLPPRRSWARPPHGGLCVPPDVG